MISISFLLLTFLCGSILSAPAPNPALPKIGNPYTASFCQELNDEKNDETKGRSAKSGYKLICSRKDTDFVKKALLCGKDTSKTAESFESCLSILDGEGANAPCSDWGKYFKCGVKKMGPKCGGEEASKFIAWSIDYAYVTEPSIHPAVFQKCHKEILKDLQSIYA